VDDSLPTEGGFPNVDVFDCSGMFVLSYDIGDIGARTGRGGSDCS
jgi:hypothetical protein